MYKFKRPEQPSDFSANVNGVKQAVKYAVDNGTKPDFKDKWGRYKEKFFLAQESKCGYCETIISGDYGDIEHYRPKALVTSLSDDPEDWGTGVIRNTIPGRKFIPSCSPGYWWLAYEWSNYLLSCKICNQPYKKNLFPIDETRKHSPKKSDIETPLLLNPYEEINFSRVVAYDRLGFMKPYNSNKRGYETIKTCGLNRENLIKARKECAEFIHYKLKKLINSDEHSQEDILFDIYNRGKKENAFAGMVRIIFEQNTDLKWTELKTIITRIIVANNV